ncbi:MULTISPECIES: MT-A70 family methyltransferase [unclassified Rhizobium]|uniref:MT-A70 family methyltransferase n=1 Tax=unclassified Rhizobium TaxID=2613769 RepID=UPI00288B4242|nr:MULTISPECIES: MT-A70 family methyltransferase [unclassified Rhizobium]
MALGEKQQSVLVAACQTGTYDALSEADRQSAVKLHEKGFLARDPKVSGRWYPTSAAHEFTGIATGQAVPVVANSERAIASITVGKRLRTLSEEKVAALMASIPEHGLRNPISVYGLTSDEVVELSAGEHRLEAMRRLGYETVPCVHYQGDALDRELWEIDENLIRSDLTPADRALFVFRRKEIYLLKHPETAKGVSQGEGGRTALDPRRQVGDEVKRFTAATAEATGQSERSIQRDAERGEKVSERALRMISATPLNTGATLDRLKRLEPEQQIAWIEGALADRRETEAKAKQFRTEKMQMSRTIRADIVKAIADKGTAVAGKMPRAAFPIGYVDPPWQQEAWSDETGQDKGLMYPSMPLDEIKALCAGDASPFTPDAVLWLWVPFNRIDDGIDVLEAWGFEHVSAIVWDKVDIGMGRWVRDRAEMVLIGKRGKISLAPEMGTQPPSLYSEKKGEHSRKPVWFAEQLDGLYPDMPKLELFQRKESLAEGDIRLSGKWSFWGFEASPDVVVDTAPDQQAARVADEPIEAFEVFRKGRSYASFEVYLGQDGSFEISSRFEMSGFCGSAHPRSKNSGSFDDAVRRGLLRLRAELEGVLSDRSSVCSDRHRADARYGLRCIEEIWEARGLSEGGAG